MRIQRIVYFAALAAATGCSLQDPNDISVQDVFESTLSASTLTANGTDRSTVSVSLKGRTKAGVQATFKTDAGKFLESNSTEVTVTAENAQASATLIAPDSAYRQANVRVAVGGYAETRIVEFVASSPSRLIVVPDKASAKADGTDAVTLTVRPIAPPLGVVSRGLPIEMFVVDGQGVRQAEREDVQVYTGSNVQFKIVSGTPAEYKVHFKMAAVISDTAIIKFNADSAATAMTVPRDDP